jgi:hypothetical protein
MLSQGNPMLRSKEVISADIRKGMLTQIFEMDFPVDGETQRMLPIDGV